MEVIKPEELHLFHVHVVSPSSEEGNFISSFLTSLGFICKYHPQPTEMLAQFPTHQWGCVLIDVRLPFYNATELQQLLKQHDPALPVIFMGHEQDINTAIKVLKANAFDFLLKPLDQQNLLDTINLALRHRQQQLVHLRFMRKIAHHLQLLSSRETEVLYLMVKGISNKKIAETLSISTKTVEQHRSNVMKKMGAESIAELIGAMTAYRIKKENSLNLLAEYSYFS